MILTCSREYAHSFVVLFLLLFANLKAVESQCSGTPLVLTANHSYQTFTSPNYPFNYPNNLNCEWRLQAENSTDAIRLEITDTAIEYHADCAYDAGEVFDGYNATAESLDKFCGTSEPVYVSIGNYLTVTFTSDYSLSFRGFKGKYKSGPRDSLLDAEEERSGIDFIIVAAAAIGGGLLLFTICAAVYACHQVKKAKRSRRVVPLEPQDALPAYQMEYIRPAPPPSYAGFYAQPFSPPPAYSETDPNPNGVIIQPTPLISNGWVSTARNQNANQRDINANTHFVRPGQLQAPPSQVGTTQPVIPTIHQGPHDTQTGEQISPVGQTTTHSDQSATHVSLPTTQPNLGLTRNENMTRTSRRNIASNQQTSNPDSDGIPGHTITNQEPNNSSSQIQQNGQITSQRGSGVGQRGSGVGQNQNTTNALATSITANATTNSSEQQQPQVAGTSSSSGSNSTNPATNNLPAYTPFDRNANTRFNGATSVAGPAVPDSSLGRRMSDVSDMSLPPPLCSDESDDELQVGASNEHA